MSTLIRGLVVADEIVRRLAVAAPNRITGARTECVLCSARNPMSDPQTHDEQCPYRLAREYIELLDKMREIASPSSRESILTMLRAALYCIDPGADAGELAVFCDPTYPGVAIVRVPKAKHVSPMRQAMEMRLPLGPIWDFVGPASLDARQL